MVLSNISDLKADADQALERGRKPREVVAWYAGSTVAIAAVLTLLNILLDYRMDHTGGLGDMGLRTILATVQAILPMAQVLALGCLELGYLHAIMRIARKQYADRTDLMVGFRKLFPMLRLGLLQGALYCLLLFLSYQVASAIYMLTPWADSLLELMTPFLNSGNMLDLSSLITDAFLAQAMPLVIPMLLLWAVVGCVMIIPVAYRMRMCIFCLLDDPNSRAMAAMRTSVRITRGNCLKLFRLDLSFWWFYLVLLLVGMVAYLDVILSMLGIYSGLDPMVFSLLCYGLYLAATFAATYFLMNRVQCTYVMAYESICDRPKDNGVVLGNIFQM